MHIDSEFCNKVVQIYSERFTEHELNHEYKSMDVHIAGVAIEIFKIAFEEIQKQKD